jgi:hypothetical protein
MKAKFLIWLKEVWQKSKKTIWLICAFLSVLGIGYLAGCNRLRKERALNVANIIAIRDTIKHSFVTIDGLRNSVYEKNAIILSQDESIKAGIIERDRLKALHLKDLLTNTDLSGTIQILRDSLKLVPGTTIITIKDSSGVAQNYVKIPFTLLNLHEQYIDSLKAGMGINKKAWFKLQIPFSGTISVGTKKIGLFKTIPVGIFVTTNPYIHVNSMDVLIVQDQKKFYDKFWFHALCGGIIVESANILLKK